MALIDNKEDYEAFLRVVKKLIDIDPERKTEEGFCLRFLTRKIDQYERKDVHSPLNLLFDKKRKEQKSIE